MSRAIPISAWEKTVRIPFGRTKDIGTVDLNTEVEVVIRGKIKAIRAEVPAGTEYKEQKFRPAEVEIDMESATMGDMTNTFTKIAESMESDD